MLKCVVVSFGLFSLTLAAISIGRLEPKPEKFKDKEGCYINEFDAVIPYHGVAWPSKKECMEYLCDEEYVTYTTCGIAQTLPPCKVVEDKGKPYPDCCPRINCPIIDSNNTSTTD